MSRSQLMHLAFAAVYLTQAAILTAEAAYAHAGCAVLEAALYALLAWPPPRR